VTHPAEDSPLLVARGLHVAFHLQGQTHEAVRDVAFEVRRGRVLAMVGESGSGKSAIALSVLGLLPANARVAGSITLAGQELVGAGQAVLRSVRGGRIGAIFQEPGSALNPVFSIGYQIAEAIRAHRKVRRAPAARRVHDLLDTVGLEDPVRIARSYPHELSGGQLQRAMIAMAISCEPDALIADEPTTALDVTVQAGILDLLRDLRGRLGIAILLITHDMGVVADIADDVVVLHDGQIVERAPVLRLFAEPGHERTRALLSAVPRLDEPESAAPPRGTAGARAEPAVAAVQLRDLVVEYRARRGARMLAVDGVGMHIGAGEVLGLVGESGSGKTTVGRALAGLAPITAGEVCVAGTDIAHASRSALRAVRARLGIVFQDPASSLDPRRTAGDSIAEPLRLHSDLQGPPLRRRVAELLDAVALALPMGGRYPHEMSGGQRQRVAIARAIALNPALLIADEPTSALDVTVQAHILRLLLSLQRRYGFACLFISHDLAVTQLVADRIAVMRRGRVVEQGPTTDLLRAPQQRYTQRLLAAAPVADPRRQADRRAARRESGGAGAPAP
jgi:peptide/nickel transport system ATP-binding protein